MKHTKTEQLIGLEESYTAHNYKPVPVVIAKAKGARVWDVEGKEYIDMMSAYSAASLGHANKKILKTLAKQAKLLDVTSRSYYNDKLPEWFEAICKLTGMGAAIPMNTGAEATDTALKVARKWGELVKGVEPNCGEVIACEGNFHGRTLGAIAMSTEQQYKSHFGPHVPGMKSIPFGNLEALEKAITPNTVAFFIEPIQGEAGIRVPPGGFLAAASRLCKKHNVLLIVDEIQTGLCRTGAMFCHQTSGITPDLMTLGKALGGGVYPVSAVVGRADVLGVLKPGDHGSTFGGNAIAAAVSLKAIELLSDPKIVTRTKELGDWAIDYLRECTHDLSIVTDIRGRGLFIGVEIDKRIPARVVVDMLKEVGVLTKDTHGTTIRLAPPLTIKRKDLHTALAALVSILIALD